MTSLLFLNLFINIVVQYRSSFVFNIIISQLHFFCQHIFRIFLEYCHLKIKTRLFFNDLKFIRQIGRSTYLLTFFLGFPFGFNLKSLLSCPSSLSIKLSVTRGRPVLVFYLISFISSGS
jgi:hypothetical protein